MAGDLQLAGVVDPGEINIAALSDEEKAKYTIVVIDDGEEV